MFRLLLRQDLIRRKKHQADIIKMQSQSRQFRTTIRNCLDFLGQLSEIVFMEYIKRSIANHLLEYSAKKIILLSGPRQVGKTTLAKSLMSDSSYYNYDIKDNAHVFLKNEWNKDTKLVIFDELHKMKNWKLWLKGHFDNQHLKKQAILVTGSARLDVSKKMGDSLAGRFFSYRLNPLDLKELKKFDTTENNYKKLIAISGFPEPFYNGTERFYGQWKRTHSDLILRQDLMSVEHIKDIDSIEILIQLLSERVGSTISVNALAEDLQKDEKTVKKWIRSLENLFIIFRVNPYSKNISKAIKKAGKYYFYDTARVRGDESQKLENLVALSLKKEMDFQQDVEGRDYALQFAKLRDHKELDFLILKDNKPNCLIEVKLSDNTVSKNFKAFEKFFKNCQKIQLVKNITHEFSNADKVYVKSCLKFLENLDLA